MPEYIAANSIELDPEEDNIFAAGSFELDKEEEPEPSMLDRAASYGKGLAHTARAVAETGAGIVTGLAAFPISKGTGLIELGLTGGDVEAAKKAEEKAAQQIQFEPTTDEARGAMEAVGKVLEPVFGMAREMGELPGESWKSPALRYVGGVVSEVGLPILAGAVVKGGIRGAKERAKLREEIPVEKPIERVAETTPETLKERVVPEETAKVVPAESIKLDEVVKETPVAETLPDVKVAAPPEIVQPGATSGAKEPAEPYWPGSDEAHFAFSEMKSQLQGAETKTVTEVNGETFVAGSGYPQWFRDISKKHDLSAKETTSFINKYLLQTEPVPRTFKGQLTDRQGAIYDDIIKAAQKEAEPYARIQEDIDALSGADKESVKNAFLEEITAEQGLTESERAFAARDAEENLTPKPTKESYIGKKETGEISGVPNDFNLVHPETEIGTLQSKKNMTPTADFLKEPPPVKPAEAVPVETKESRLAVRAEADSIAAKLTEDFGDLVEYKTMNMKDQANRAAEVMAADYGKAKRMAMGEELPPQGIREATMYEAVKIRAIKEGDVDTLQKLATESTVPTRLSEYGQAIKAADSRIMEDPVKVMQDVAKTRSDVIEKTTGKKPVRQTEEIKRLSAELETTKKALDEHIAITEARAKESAIDELIAPKKPQAERAPSVYGSKNRIVTTKAYEIAKNELRKQLGTQLSSGLDPTIAMKMEKIGMYHLEAGARDFAVWSGKVIKDVGEWVKPHLQEIWDQTRNVFRKGVADSATAKIKKSLADQDHPDIGRHVQELAKHFVSTGVKDRNALVTAVHNAIKEVIPQITPRETMDAISGYGKYKLLTKEEVATQLRDLKGQMQQVAKLEDLEKRQPPLKTGVERRTPSNEERRLIKLVDEAKKKYGIQVVDKETQLKSSLDAIKTRLTNEIADLETQIATEQKIVKNKTHVNYDAEAIKLKAKRDELKARFDAIFGKAAMTKEQKIVAAIKATEKSIAEYTRRIEQKDLTPMNKRTELHSTELDKLRTVREGLKNQFQELKYLANPKKTPGQIALQSLKTRLLNETKKFNEKLNALDFTQKEKRVTVLDPEATRLKYAHEQAKRNYQALTEKSGVPTKEEAANIVHLSKIVADARTAMAQGGDRLSYGAAKVAYENYVNALKGENASIKTLLKNRIQETKTSWKENKVKAVTGLIKDSIVAISDNSVSFVASVDNSFLGRQGLNTLLTHPTVWANAAKKSFSDIYKTMVSKHGGKAVRDAVMADAYSRPNYLNGNYERAKLIPKTEEQFPTSLPERLPLGIGRVFKASENAFLNSGVRMRINTFDLLQDIAKKQGVDVTNKVWIEDTGRLINSVTARGDLGKLGEGGVVRLILWAPKMLKGNWDVLTAHTGGAGLQTPFARQQARINLLKIVAATASAVAVANALKPGSAETNPLSSDFLKIKVGNTRFDISGGKGSIITLLARAITFSSKSTATGKTVPLTSGKYGSKTLFDVGIDFLVNKTTPAARTTIDVAKGRNFSGQKPTAGSVAYGLTTPISIQNFVKNFYGPDADGSVAAVVGSILDLFGVSANTYDTKKRRTRQ